MRQSGSRSDSEPGAHRARSRRPGRCTDPSGHVANACCIATGKGSRAGQPRGGHRRFIGRSPTEGIRSAQRAYGSTRDLNYERVDASNQGREAEVIPMKKLAFVVGAMILALAAGTALAQGRGGGQGGSGGGHFGGGSGGGWSGGASHGGGWSGGAWQGGGGNRGAWQGGGWNGGAWHGGGWNRGAWQGGGWNGGAWHGGGWNRGAWNGSGWRGGWWGSGWRGGWWGPSFGVAIGGPAFWGAWPYPFFAPFPAFSSFATLPFPASDPDSFVQQTPNEAPPPQSDYWYYCTDPAGYYPYVQKCSRPWMQVIPQRGGGAPALAPTQ